MKEDTRNGREEFPPLWIVAGVTIHVVAVGQGERAAPGA